jgi:hypothetical protein
MSTINTNGINVNYPVPGVNNNSQGFRDNFASIKTNLNTAGNEISDLQNKVVVKSALENTVINNDMANTLISNASTKNFRATTYNLGDALAGTVVIDTSLGDVHYGTVTGNVTLQFNNWAPAGTQREIELQLAFSNPNAVISFPSEVVSSNNNFGVTTLENYANVASVATVTTPYAVEQLNYKFSTVDCGTSVSVDPVNRPRKSTQIQHRTPAPTGFNGDVEGTVAIDANYLYVCTDTFDSGGSNTVPLTVTATYSGSNEVEHSSTSSISANKPIIFAGTTFGNIEEGVVYYVKTIVSSTRLILSDTRTAGTAGSPFVLEDGSGSSCSANVYLGSDIWKRIALTAW